MDHEDYLLTEQEVAGLAKVSINTVRYWRQTGMLPFVKVGKHPRIWLSVFNKTFQKPETSSPKVTKR
jgi:excisionase family DNA binding protein